MKFDLNCDLGEGEPLKRTAALMRSITSANIACGGHAGDLESMRATVVLAIEFGVNIGAHPGLSDRANFGRRPLPISVPELKLLLLHQISALERIAQSAGARLHHVKLHGALYHMVEEQPILSKAYIEVMREFWPRALIFSLGGGAVARAAANAHLRCWGEGFLDRGYDDATHLIPRDEAGSVLTMAQFAERLDLLRADGMIRTLSGSVKLKARTWCIHSDSPDALTFAKRAAQLFR